VGRIVTVSDGAGRSVTVSKWGVAQTSRHRYEFGKQFTYLLTDLYNVINVSI
jgi:hypothetical protein